MTTSERRQQQDTFIHELLASIAHLLFIAGIIVLFWNIVLLHFVSLPSLNYIQAIITVLFINLLLKFIDFIKN